MEDVCPMRNPQADQNYALLAIILPDSGSIERIFERYPPQPLRDCLKII